MRKGRTTLRIISKLISKQEREWSISWSTIAGVLVGLCLVGVQVLIGETTSSPRLVAWIVITTAAFVGVAIGHNIRFRESRRE